MKYPLHKEQILAYAAYLRNRERSPATIEKYLRDVRAFAAWLDGGAVTKEAVTAWKEHLIASGRTPATVNGALAALNGLFGFLGWEDCRASFLKVQRRVFRDSSRDLSRQEYERLVQTAEECGRPGVALLLETICATGIRVSELRYITVEAARLGRTDISLKGKLRTVLLPGKLCRKLLKYAEKQKTATGAVFLAGDGTPMTRFQIWRAMKLLCSAAGVEPSKVFPHNLRHLFAATFYRVTRDIVKLADVLGHSSLSTTRVYLLSTGTEHARQLERLGLVS